jgi:hypothetical protein
MAALIAAAGATDYTVTVGSSSAQAHSLNVADSHATFAVGTGNALTIAGALTVDAGKITLNGGTIQAGFIDLESGGHVAGLGHGFGPDHQLRAHPGFQQSHFEHFRQPHRSGLASNRTQYHPGN